ncbi:MAG: hypothetical protein ACRELG_09425 [Gemmataceae bacterium]
MTKILHARNFIGSGSPASNGERLADTLLEQDPAAWDDVVIDARDCPPEYLGSALFNALWQRVSERQPKLLSAAKLIRWEFAHPFQKTTFDLLRSRFKPRQTA